MSSESVEDDNDDDDDAEEDNSVKREDDEDDDEDDDGGDDGGEDAQKRSSEIGGGAWASPGGDRDSPVSNSVSSSSSSSLAAHLGSSRGFSASTATGNNIAKGAPDIEAVTAAAKKAIQRSFLNAFVKIRGERLPILTLKLDGHILSLERQPTEHQVKDFNIIPTPVVKLNATIQAPRACDFVTAHLHCDENMRQDDSIFLAALNAKLITNNELPFINLRVTKDMLKGRTKGYSFVLRFTYVSDGQEIDTIYTTPFWLFSNVNQAGFPKSERDSYLRPQWRDTSGNFSKRKR